jgi:Rhodanese-like domain
MAPGAIAYTWLGYAGQEAASGQSSAIREGMLGLALLAAVVFLPRLLRRLKGLRFIDPDELKRRLDSHEQLALIDVRTPDEFLGPLGHIVSAKNIPVVQFPGEIGKINESREKLLVTI